MNNDLLKIRFKQISMTCASADKIRLEIDRSLPKGQKSAKQSYAHALYMRTLCILRTLNKCRKVTDFQSMFHAQRLLLEILVEQTILHHEDDDSISEKINDWEDSAKLHSAQRIIKHYKNTFPDNCDQIISFIRENKERIEGIRKKRGWSNHPERWSGPKNKFIDDLVRAKTLEIFEVDIERIYIVDHPRINWTIHGLSLVGIRNLEEKGFLTIVATSLITSVKLSFEIIRLVLKEFCQTMENYEKVWSEEKKDIRMQLLKV